MPRETDSGRLPLTTRKRRWKPLSGTTDMVDIRILVDDHSKDARLFGRATRSQSTCITRITATDATANLLSRSACQRCRYCHHGASDTSTPAVGDGDGQHDCLRRLRVVLGSRILVDRPARGMRCGSTSQSVAALFENTWPERKAFEYHTGYRAFTEGS